MRIQASAIQIWVLWARVRAGWRRPVRIGDRWPACSFVVVGVFGSLGDLDIEIEQVADSFLLYLGDRAVE